MSMRCLLAALSGPDQDESGILPFVVMDRAHGVALSSLGFLVLITVSRYHSWTVVSCCHCRDPRVFAEMFNHAHGFWQCSAVREKSHEASLFGISTLPLAKSFGQRPLLPVQGPAGARGEAAPPRGCARRGAGGRAAPHAHVHWEAWRGRRGPHATAIECSQRRTPGQRQAR